MAPADGMRTPRPCMARAPENALHLWFVIVVCCSAPACSLYKRLSCWACRRCLERGGKLIHIAGR